MESRRGKHVIFGAGPLGFATAKELLSRGYEVEIVTRSGKASIPEGAIAVKGDAADTNGSIEICQGAEAVYNCIGLPYEQWEQLVPIMKGIMAGAADSGAKLIYPDNLYAYGPQQGKLTEDTPYRPVGRKDKLRAEIADMVLAAHRSGQLRAVIGRGSDFYGPHVTNSSLGSHVFGNAIRGKAAQALGNIDTPHTYMYIGDFAWGIAELAEREESLGQVWHLPSAPTVTTREIIDMIYRQAGVPTRIAALSRNAIRVLGLFMPLLRELKETIYQFENPYIVDHTKFERAFGARTTPHKQAIQETLDWYRSEIR